MAVAGDVRLVAQRLAERPSEREANVLGGVVVVHMQVAGAAHVQPEAAVAGEQVEHMVEEAKAGGVDVNPLVRRGRVEAEHHRDVGFVRGAAHRSGAGGEVGHRAGEDVRLKSAPFAPPPREERGGNGCPDQSCFHPTRAKNGLRFRNGNRMLRPS